jgi:membrane protease YdiL (CAAX protease family)
MNKRRFYTILVAILVLALWNPYTRQTIIWLLPLGSGFDDLVFVLLLIVGLTILVVRGIKLHKEVIQEQIKENWKWFVVGIVVFAVVVFAFLQIYPIY